MQLHNYFKKSEIPFWGVWCVVCLIYFINSLPAHCNTTNPRLAHADSLVYQGKFADVVEYLLPLESSFNNETTINKYHYYGLLSAWYLRQQGYQSAIPFLEKKSQFNETSIQDSYLLAHLFSTEFANRNKTEYYVRKALILDDKINRLGLRKDHTDKQIAKLHYLLGILACRWGNKFIANDILKSIMSCDSIDLNLANHLTEEINSIPDNPNDSSRTIRTLSLQTLNETLRYDGHPKSKIFNKGYDIANASALDSIAKDPEIDLFRYLHTVFNIEDSYDTSEIDKSVIILTKAFKIANSQQFYKIPSEELCELYIRLGRGDCFLKQYDSAITWFLLSLSNSRKLENGSRYSIQALGEITDIYWGQGEKYKSLIYADEMLEELMKLNSASGLDDTSLTYMARYAHILANTGFNSLSEEFHKFVINNAYKQSNAYKLACNNYASYLMLSDRLEEACQYYFLIKDAFPTPMSMSNLAIAYLISNKRVEAERTFHEYYDKNLSILKTVLRNFTEDKWEDFWREYGYEFYIGSNFLAHQINSNRSLIEGYNATILSKTLPLTFKKKLHKLLATADNPDIQIAYKDYMLAKKELASRLDSITIKQQKIEKITRLESSLLAKINLIDSIDSIFGNYNTISASLTKDEVAIEFCQYLDILAPSDSISYKYAAYIIRPENNYPTFVEIGDEVDISNLIYFSQTDEFSISDLYNQSVIGNLIWSKLMPYIKDKHVVYFSPIGELSLLNHNLLTCSGIRLGDQFDLRRISSTGLLADYLRIDSKVYTSAIIYGDIDYDTDSTVINDTSRPYLIHRVTAPFTPKNNRFRDGWESLSYTKQETDSISRIMNYMGCPNIKYNGSDANEDSFKALDYNAPSIIHIATHGFSYFKNNEEDRRNKIKTVSPYTTESILMSWTGLLFSGANNVWKEKSLPKNFNDGILTATEISLLHLDSAKLVVLSACNTGLGTNDTFGITTGLQKAFKLAGVESILMSLWRVPDESTALLMTKFYEALLAGQERHEALKIAMKKTKEVFPDPYYWGAFVILD